MRTTKQLISTMRARGLVTVAEAALIALRSQKAVRSWCRAGHVESRRSGLMTFVVLASLQKWIGAQEERT